MELQHSKLSVEAMGALMMCLQKCILEQTDIVPILQGLKFSEVRGELFVINPPLVKFENFEEAPAADFHNMKAKELKRLAKEHNVPGFSRMKKIDLVNALRDRNIL